MTLQKYDVDQIRWKMIRFFFFTIVISTIVSLSLIILFMKGIGIDVFRSDVTPSEGVNRIYFIAAEEVEWDYAPDQQDMMMNQPFNEEQAVFVVRGQETMGRIYKKVIYRAYTDETFTTLRPRTSEWEHLGLLGPVLHAAVGDTITVVFRNNTTRPYTMHPHGVFYDKSAEGAPYADGTSGTDKADDAVAPGTTYTYVWPVPQRAGPGPNDPSSIIWPYHSHLNEPRDTNTGLIGAIIITAKQHARRNGRPSDVDREFVVLFSVMDENVSWYLDEMIDTHDGLIADPLDSEVFVEGNLMHMINGYVFANLPRLIMRKDERVRWYLFALGTEVDLHTPHWHGNTGIESGYHRVDTVSLLPATTSIVDMIPDNPGIWMFHCHVNDHIDAGMTALYRVEE